MGQGHDGQTQEQEHHSFGTLRDEFDEEFDGCVGVLAQVVLHKFLHRNGAENQAEMG